MANQTEFPATPYFGTRYRIDTPETVLQEPPFALTRDANHIARPGTVSNMRRVPDVGWQLQPYQSRAGDSAETSAAQTGIMKTVADGGTLQGSSMLTLFPGYQQRTDTGATYGADNVTTGDEHYHVEVPAGQEFTDANQTSDQTAFPGIPGEDADPDMVRLVVDTVNDDPNAPLHVKITVPMALVGGHRCLGKTYFSGPASQRTDPSGNITGLGAYGFRWNGDGTADLFELQSIPDFMNPQWIAVSRNIRWCAPSAVAGSAHHIEILKREFTTPRGNRTGYVIINVADSGTAAGQFPTSPIAMAGTTNPTGITKFYATCDDPAKWVPAIHTPVRKDVRSDSDPHFQLSRAVYPLAGYVVDDVIDTFVWPGYSGAEFRAYFLGDVPPGSTATIDVYAADQDPVTGTALSASGRTNLRYGSSATYTIPPLVDHGNVSRSFRIKVSVTSNGTVTPTVAVISFIKDGVGAVYDIGETIIDHPIGEMEMSGQDFETGRESCALEFSDLKGEGTALAFRSKMPFRVDVPYPTTGFTVDEDSQRSILFRGYVGSASSEKLYKDPLQGIDTNARRYHVELVGMHQRLDEAVIPLGFSLGADPAISASSGAFEPYLASDAIYYFLNWGGFGSDEIGWDLGDARYPIRLFVKANESDPSLNPGAPLGELAMDYAQKYLGRYLIYCPNSSRVAPADGDDPTGMWDMPEPPYAPYRPLVRFEPAPVAGGSGLYMAHSPAWPDWTYRGRAVPVRPFFRGESKRPEAPEFNWLMVVGSGDTAGAYDPIKLSTAVWRPTSMNAIAGNDTQDPTDVSFIGRPVRALYVDSQLSTPGAVQFVGRRLIDYAGTGRMMRPFVAALTLVMDQDAPYQRRKRPLRPNDCIVFRGKPCVVRSAAIMTNKDGFQMQRIEAQELPADPDNPIT